MWSALVLTTGLTSLYSPIKDVITSKTLKIRERSEHTAFLTLQTKIQSSLSLLRHMEWSWTDSAHQRQIETGSSTLQV